jgi:hypothetical protein
LADPAFAAKLQTLLIPGKQRPGGEFVSTITRKVLVLEKGDWRSDKERARRHMRALHAIRLCPLADIHQAIKLFRKLVEQPGVTPYPILGVPGDALIEQIDRLGLERVFCHRNSETFVDAAKHLIWGDLDGPPVPEALLEEGQGAASPTGAIFPQIVEWLARDALPPCFHRSTLFAYPTSKHGMVDFTCAHLRIGFWSREPLTYSQRRTLWENVNCVLRERVPEWKDAKSLFDLSICKPETICITAPPELIDLDQLGAPGQPTYQRKLIEVLGDDDEVSLPPEWITGATSGPVRPRRSPGANKGRSKNKVLAATAKEIASTIGPGNYHEPFLRLGGKLATMKPVHRQEEWLGDLPREFERLIRATSPPAEVEERIRRHVNRQSIERNWQSAIRAKYPYPAVATEHQPGLDLEQARSLLFSALEEHFARERAFR